MFDWDNIFASMLALVDSDVPLAKRIAYSNLIQIIKSRTINGFVPNWSAGGWKSVDRSEPPVGSKVLLDIYTRFGDKWLVEFLYDDLLAWHEWNWGYRVLPQSGLLCLGSQLCENGTYCIGNARAESGLDQNPMWDCPGADDDGNGGDCYSFFNPETHQMQLSVVGMSSLFVMEAYALANLSVAIGRPDGPRLLQRANLMGELLRTKAWDDQGKAFTNILGNGTFYRRIAPTSFYPLITGHPTASQATQMVQTWLLSPEHFCIDISGGWPHNTKNPDTCFWGMPSIEAVTLPFSNLFYSLSLLSFLPRSFSFFLFSSPCFSSFLFLSHINRQTEVI